MARVRTIEPPAALATAGARTLSPDGRAVVCRLEGEQAGLYVFEVGGEGRPLRLDAPGRRYHSPSWSACGDVLFHVAREGGAPQVGAVPAFGRGAPVERDGTGIAVSDDGSTLAIADPAAGQLRVATAERGNSPFGLPDRAVGPLAECDPSRPVALDLTRDGRWVVAVRETSPGAPSLWSYPIEGGAPQVLVEPLPAPAFLSFALSESLLVVLEIRRGPLRASRLLARTLTAGSLGLLRLGPALAVLQARHALVEQRPTISPDGKQIALFVGEAPELPDAPAAEPALQLFPAVGGAPVRAGGAPGLRGTARFLPSGELVVDGGERVSILSL